MYGVRFRESEQYKQHMDQCRYIVWSALLPHLKKKDQKNVQDSWPFPWDQKTTGGKTLTKEQRDKAAAAFWEKRDRKKQTENGNPIID